MKIGQGSYSEVFGYERKGIAMKVISKKKHVNPILLESFQREIHIQQQLTQRNISYLLPLIQARETRNSFRLQFPYMRYDLIEYMKQTILEEKQRLHLMLQIAQGVGNLHHYHVCHRDLKPENILISENQACIADFGFAIVLPKHDNIEKLNAVGSKEFIAPEVFTQYYSFPVDIWSLGCIFYFIWTREKLFLSPTIEKIRKLHRWFTPRHIQINNPDLNSLLRHMLRLNPHERFNISQVIEALFKIEVN